VEQVGKVRLFLPGDAWTWIATHVRRKNNDPPPPSGLICKGRRRTGKKTKTGKMMTNSARRKRKTRRKPPTQARHCSSIPLCKVELWDNIIRGRRLIL